jgi:hypothetical protein
VSLVSVEVVVLGAGERATFPDTFGIFEQMEYLIGFGFVACQTYATAVAGRSKISKREALAVKVKT